MYGNQPIYNIKRGAFAFTVVAKLGNMRKDAEFTIYPISDPTSAILQSESRIAEINLLDGTGKLSKHRSGGAYAIHLMPALGATAITVPQALCEALLEAPCSGEFARLGARQATYTHEGQNDL